MWVPNRSYLNTMDKMNKKKKTKITFIIRKKIFVIFLPTVQSTQKIERCTRWFEHVIGLVCCLILFFSVRCASLLSIMNWNVIAYVVYFWWPITVSAVRQQSNRHCQLFSFCLLCWHFLNVAAGTETSTSTQRRKKYLKECRHIAKKKKKQTEPNNTKHETWGWYKNEKLYWFMSL